MQKMIDLSIKANNFEKRQNIQLSIFRNDFMMDKFKKFIFQIEFNTIACSMGFFSDSIKKFYSHFSKKYPKYYEKYFNSSNEIPLGKENVIESMADSMVKAIKLFSPDNYQNTIILTVVQENERNEYDQRSIETVLWDKQ